MNPSANDVVESLDSLRREIASLGERTAALEKALVGKVPELARRPDNASKAAGLDEELVLVISVAIAAFLGVKPRIRQIVLLQSHPWSQQGRVTIQASHALTIHHG
jgi:methylmalonyl-CoA carboxyltransferase 12S subunit